MIRPFTRMTLSITSVRHVAILSAAQGVIAREYLGTLNIGPRGSSCFYGATARGEVSAVQSDTRLFAVLFTSLSSALVPPPSFFSGRTDTGKGVMPHIFDAHD
jgi:ABC-type uncharacterized transport system permease subunit